MLYCTYFASMLIIQLLQIVCPQKVCGGGGKSIVLLPASCAPVETFVIIRPQKMRSYVCVGVPIYTSVDTRFFFSQSISNIWPIKLYYNDHWQRRIVRIYFGDGSLIHFQIRGPKVQQKQFSKPAYDAGKRHSQCWCY